MPTKKQLSNLKRGGINGTATTAARAKAAKERYAAEEERVGELAREDLPRALEEIAGVMARALVRLHRRAEASGKEPSRALVDASREFRATLETVTAYRAAGADAASAEAFFAELDMRVGAILERTSATLQPVVEPG